jgi:hypothetical protein
MKNNLIRSLYFYAVSIIALFMVAYSLIDLLNIGLKTWVFTDAGHSSYECIARTSDTVKPGITDPYIGPTQEECDRQNEQNRRNELRNRQSSAVRDLSMLAVSLPLFLFHFRIVQKEWKERKEA